MSWFNIIKDCGKKHTKQTNLPKGYPSEDPDAQTFEEWLKDKKMPFHIDVGEEE